MSGPSSSSFYLPSLWTRTRQLARTAWHVLVSTPRVALRPGEDCVVVCDPIEAYRALYTPAHLAALRALLTEAALCGVPIVYTRWVRVDASRADAVDAKGHWSDYVPALSQCRFLPEVAAHTTPDLICSTVFPNAFAHADFAAFCERVGARRLVLAGGWAEACVLSTARAALEHGLCPVVVADATVGHLVTPTLVQVQLLYGEVVCAA